MVTGCAVSGRIAADQLASQHGYSKQMFRTGYFDLAGWLNRGESPDLHVYFEGDGKAWLNIRRLSHYLSKWSSFSGPLLFHCPGVGREKVSTLQVG